jgi:Flp pilus assembly protein CpaB
MVTSLGAIVVFFAVLTFVSDVNSKVGSMTNVLQFKRDVMALEPIESDMVELVQVPARWVPATALRSPRDVVGLVAATGYVSGSVIQKGMLVPRPGIQPGYREVAIVVDAETGVAGKVHPGDLRTPRRGHPAAGLHRELLDQAAAGTARRR